MTNLTLDFEPKTSLLEDVPMPRDLHSKIMKRVFIAGYGKYLYLSTSILFVNFGVLGVELYRKLAEVRFGSVVRNLIEGFTPSAAYMQDSLATLYSVLPMQSVLATGITACLCAYMASLFVRFHRDPASVGFFRSVVS
jgi:hypothetical protein